MSVEELKQTEDDYMEAYRLKKIEVLNITAGKIVALQKMKKVAQLLAIMKGTGSEYLVNKWDGDFAGRYLNSDATNQLLWLKMLGVDNPTQRDCFALHRAMLFFYNHSLTHFLKEDAVKRMRINAYGNGENWCKLWLRLNDTLKDRLIKFF